VVVVCCGPLCVDDVRVSERSARFGHEIVYRS
jgi:hypothetical protein